MRKKEERRSHLIDTQAVETNPPGKVKILALATIKRYNVLAWRGREAMTVYKDHINFDVRVSTKYTGRVIRTLLQLSLFRVLKLLSGYLTSNWERNEASFLPNWTIIGRRRKRWKFIPSCMCTAC